MLLGHFIIPVNGQILKKQSSHLVTLTQTERSTYLLVRRNKSKQKRKREKEKSNVGSQRVHEHK